MRPALFLIVLLALSGVLGCRRAPRASANDAGPGAPAEVASAAGSAAPAALPTQGQNSVAPAPPKDRPLLGITSFVATVYKEPRDTADKLGYLRVGAKVARSEEPVSRAGCPDGWYEIFPRGFICAGKDATTDMSAPILKAGEAARPNLEAPLPYRYGFVRAVLPLYLRVPTVAEQEKSEFKLKEHLEWYKENELEVNRVILGAHDVAIDSRGVARPDKKLGELGLEKNSLEEPLGVLLGGATASDPPPFWLADGKRTIPNISDFVVPDYAVFADRARRKTGLALVGSFEGGPEAGGRRFAITTDLRLAPTSKVKPDTGSPWHGVELDDAALSLPLAFVRAQGARTYKIQKGKVVVAGEAEHRSVHALTGKMRTVEGVKYYRTKDKRWLHQQDVGLALAPASWPNVAEKGEKWIEVSITNQTLVLWEGKKPVYATLVSTGKAGMADPKTSTATVRGTFRIRNKHITATMDSNEASVVGGKADTTATGDDDEAPAPKPKPATVTAASKNRTDAKVAAKNKEPKKGGKPSKEGTKAKAKPDAPKTGSSKPNAPKAASKPAGGAPPLPHEDYVPRKGDGLYGVTRRRGEGKYVLRDVPYIQYFAQGYALHGAYWHDVFGTPRSHGCINLSPVDAHRVFLWTEPAVPEGWHAINTGEAFGEGTVIIIHE